MENENLLCPKAEGFDPNELLTLVRDVGPDGQPRQALFMRAAPAMAWFYKVHPNGCLNHTIQSDERKAVVTASIYTDQSNTRPAAMATVTRYYSKTGDGQYFEQNAVTAAYRKALGYMGFGTPLKPRLVEGIEVLERSVVPEMSETGFLVPLSPEDMSAMNAPLPEMAPPTQFIEPDATAPAPAPAPAAALDATPVPDAQSPAAGAGGNEVPSTLKEALLVRAPIGKNKGKTLGEIVADEGPNAKKMVRWYANKLGATSPNAPFTVAAQIWCEQNGC